DRDRAGPPRHGRLRGQRLRRPRPGGRPDRGRRRRTREDTRPNPKARRGHPHHARTRGPCGGPRHGAPRDGSPGLRPPGRRRRRGHHGLRTLEGRGGPRDGRRDLSRAAHTGALARLGDVRGGSRPDRGRPHTSWKRGPDGHLGGFVGRDRGIRKKSDAFLGRHDAPLRGTRAHPARDGGAGDEPVFAPGGGV
ncbi:MAG: MBL-fold metallo-hydrolase superfamily, partial [uncultured Rubrobacteraceae bacterium]